MKTEEEIYLTIENLIVMVQENIRITGWWIISLLPKRLSPYVTYITSLMNAKTLKGYVPKSLKATLTTSSADNQTWLDSYTK